MKITVLEPLGISKNLLESTIREGIGEIPELVLFDNRNESTSALIERSKDSEVVVLSNIKFNREVIENCPKLKMICVAFTGVDHIDLDCCKEKGIQVSNCAGYSTSAVADLVFGLVISLSRNLIKCDAATREGKTKNGLVGFELEGKKFGVLGLGAIGTRVATIAKAFGCDVYYYSRTKKNVDGITYLDKDELLKTCDIVSLHVPNNDSTRGMIGEREFKLMKSSSLLINCARGPVVNTEALVNALNTGEIMAAGIDVFDSEPPLDLNEPLLKVKNALLTPHVAFASDGAFIKRADIVRDNLKAYVSGKQLNKII
jgi:D-3-phosphoglycerate dehydrogenase